MGRGTEFSDDVVAGLWIGATSGMHGLAASLVFCFFAVLELSRPAAVLRLSLDFFCGAIFFWWVVEPKLLQTKESRKY